MNTLSQSKQTSMLVRIITGIIFVLVVFPCLFLGGWFHFILVFLLAGFATYEILQAPGKDHFPLGIKILSYCFMFLFLISFFTKGWITRNNPFQLNVTPDFYSPLRFLYPILLVGTYFFIGRNYQRESSTSRHHLSHHDDGVLSDFFCRHAVSQILPEWKRNSSREYIF